MDRAKHRSPASLAFIVTILWRRAKFRREALFPAYEALKIRGARVIINRSQKEARLSEIEPISFRPRQAGSYTIFPAGVGQPREQPAYVTFNRQELTEILALYGRMVAAGEWRDYAMDMGKERAVFSVYRRASEYPLYRIEKSPKLARKQGQFSVVAATGLILKRGPELCRVIAVLERGMRLVEA